MPACVSPPSGLAAARGEPPCRVLQRTDALPDPISTRLAALLSTVWLFSFTNGCSFGSNEHPFGVFVWGGGAKKGGLRCVIEDLTSSEVVLYGR